MDAIHSGVYKYVQQIIELRRYFHTFPELSGQEFNTQKKIMNELEALELRPRPIAKTGVIVDIQGTSPGKTVALRADMDALQIKDECGQSYRSIYENISHACGHDGHIAMLLGVAKVLHELEYQFSGQIRLLFQPSEEIFPSGAEMAITEGVLDNVAAIFGLHLWQALEVGTAGFTYGRLMAAPDEFTIHITGSGGHGSMPQQTVDTILVAAQFVVAANTIVSRNIDPLESAVVSFGMVQAGDVFNVIPDAAILKGTVRSFSHDIRLKVFNHLEQIAQGVCQAAGAAYFIEKTFGSPPVINSPAVAGLAAAASREVLGADNVQEIQPVMGGEDFSCYLDKIPGAFIFVGSGNAKRKIVYPQHHPKFDIDENALAYGTEILLRTAFKMLA